MGRLVPERGPASGSAVEALGTELDRIAKLNVDELRALWRATMGRPAPEALSRDLIARALAYHLHEQRLGGLDPHLRRLLATLARSGPEPIRHLKIGSVIIREHEGKVHEVMVASGGFCWSGQIYSSLSTIARKITGTNWNGPRFFGLREKDEPAQGDQGPKQRVGATSDNRLGRGTIRPRSNASAAMVPGDHG
jgi:hypothetical protein